MSSSDAERCMARLAVAVMLCDGRVRPGEKWIATRAGRLGPAGKLVPDELERATSEPIDIQATCEALRRASHDSPLRILRTLAEVAVGDGKVSSVEYDTLGEIGVGLGLSRERAAATVRQVAEELGLTGQP